MIKRWKGDNKICEDLNGFVWPIVQTDRVNFEREK
jgi:hypothetical protein